jgi:hypothetical protein
MNPAARLRLMGEALQLITELSVGRAPDAVAKAQEFEKRSPVHERCLHALLSLVLDMAGDPSSPPIPLSQIKMDIAVADDVDILLERLTRRLRPILEREPMSPLRQVAMFLVIMNLIMDTPMREDAWRYIDLVFERSTIEPDHSQAKELLKHLNAFREAAWPLVPETAALKHE